MRVILLLITALLGCSEAPAAWAGLGQESPARFGLWRLPPSHFGTPVGPLTDPVSLTAIPISPTDGLAVLDSARAHNLGLIISFKGERLNQGGAYVLERWKKRLDGFCQGDRADRPDCLDLDPYIADGTIVVVNLFEANGDADTDSTKGPTMAEIGAAASYVKSIWPNLPTAVDGSHPCRLIPPGGSWSARDLDVAIINVFTGGGRAGPALDALIDGGIACAERVGLGYILNINPFGRARTSGLSPAAVESFEYAVKRAITAPRTRGTIIWRWWPETEAEVSNGVKSFPNFWNEGINPGVSEALRRIEACAHRPSPVLCEA